MSAEPVFDPIPNRILNLLTRDCKLAYAQISPDLNISALSDNLCESFSEPDREGAVEGEPLGELFWEFIGAEHELSAILTGTLPEYLIQNTHREQVDGSVRYLTLRIVPLNEVDPGQGLLLTVEDNTTIGALEQALIQERNNLRLMQASLARANDELTRLNYMKSLFLTIAAHDLRAPLSAIRGYAGLVQSGTEHKINGGDEDHQFLGFIILQVDRLNRLICDLLDLDMIEQGKLLVRPTTVNLIPLIHSVTDVLRPAAIEQGLELTTRDSDETINVLTDSDRVEQILYNLIGNALKYTPRGGRIQVGCWQEDHWGVFQVSDNGRGIAQNELARVFELYHRSEEAMKSQVRGTGLGLYIVKSLVDALGGTISVSSQAAQGTTFTVRLPGLTLA